MPTTDPTADPTTDPTTDPTAAGAQGTGRSWRGLVARQVAGRGPGEWLALVASAVLLVNAVRAVADPAGFAEYLGLPLADPADDGLVLVYAGRTAVLAAVPLVLLVRRERRSLAVVTLLAVVLPLGDALLTRAAGAPAGTVLRHVAIAAYLAATAVLLRRPGRTGPRPAV